MSISRLEFASQIEGPPEYVFDLIADMPNYSCWMPDSDVFSGTIDPSDKAELGSV